MEHSILANYQYKAVEECMSGRDEFISAPTGARKSLTLEGAFDCLNGAGNFASGGSGHFSLKRYQPQIKSLQVRQVDLLLGCFSTFIMPPHGLNPHSSLCSFSYSTLKFMRLTWDKSSLVLNEMKYGKLCILTQMTYQGLASVLGCSSLLHPR